VLPLSVNLHSDVKCMPEQYQAPSSWKWFGSVGLKWLTVHKQRHTAEELTNRWTRSGMPLATFWVGTFAIILAWQWVSAIFIHLNKNQSIVRVISHIRKMFANVRTDLRLAFPSFHAAASSAFLYMMLQNVLQKALIGPWPVAELELQLWTQEALRFLSKECTGNALRASKQP